MRARVEAKQAYLKTYNMAVQAENAAESQERKDRAARQKVSLSLSLSLSLPPSLTHTHTHTQGESVPPFLSYHTRAQAESRTHTRTH